MDRFWTILIAFIWCLGVHASRAAEHPKVLMIIVDAMNDRVGCLGSDRVPTPIPKCAPSRAAILTGRRASTTGPEGGRVATEVLA